MMNEIIIELIGILPEIIGTICISAIVIAWIKSE